MSWADDSAALNAGILREFGVEVEHAPAGYVELNTVTLAKRDPDDLSASGVLMTFFGDSEASGFVQLPAKNDLFQVDGETYRAFDVQGPDVSGGLLIHLTK